MRKGVCVMGWLAAAVLAGRAAEPRPAAMRMTFEAGTDTWRSRDPSVEVVREEGTGALPGSTAALRVRGRIEPGWNYALSDPVPVDPSRLYRFSVRVRVDRLGPGTPVPYLKCEFIGAEGAPPPGQLSTDRYDRARLGEWQELQAEFKPPPEARACWFALEKGTDGPAEIDACLDEIVLETIERLSAFDRFALAPAARERLEGLRGIHPRLYLNRERIGELRGALTGTHAEMWRELRERADAAAKRGPPAYREQDGYSGDEQLWQRDVGNTIPVLALAHVLTGEERYLNAVRDWATASCGYPTWGLGRIDGMDLATGHQLFGLALAYDWCYADLDEGTRRTIRETFERRAGNMFEAGATGKAWWHRAYMQNHLWVNACGLGAAGLAVYDEVPGADLWAGFALDKFVRTMDALGPDGASHEGVGYWEYGVEYMLKFMALARECLGVDLYGGEWWRKTARYPLVLGLPRNAWTGGNCIVDIADCPRGHWYGPDYLLRALAREYRDPYAQWLAGEIDAADVAAPGAPWMNLICFDPDVPATPPDGLPTLHHFEDMGIVGARSDWSGNESLVVFKCGPFLGHEAMERFDYDPGGGHVHPDANHFVLFGGGRWLIRDDGYRWKWTGQHNTLLVDGRGQLGEGAQWFRGSEPLAAKARPRIVRAEAGRSRDHIEGDATAAYPEAAGLQSYRRHLLFLKPDVLVVADEVRTDVPRELELRFHPELKEYSRDGDAFVFREAGVTLRIRPLQLGGGEAEVADLAVEGRHGGKEETMRTVRLRQTGADWRTAVAFSWAAAEAEPRRVTAATDGEIWTFRVGGDTVTLDWQNGTAGPTARGDREEEGR